jgi:two-component system, NarL family, response regulator NreC
LKTLRVLLADDHAIVRSGLRLLLERQLGLSVVGEVADGREAIAWIARNVVDIVVMDVGMPGLNGVEATAQILQRDPEIAVVILSMHRDETYVLRCLRAGARGYVLKESAESELIEAIRAVSGGRSFFSPKIQRLLQQEHIERVLRTGKSDSYDMLTEREREILQLITEGNTNKDIAGRLNLSVLTVETHRKNILSKLNLRGIADLILYAMRKGIVTRPRGSASCTAG